MTRARWACLACSVVTSAMSLAQGRPIVDWLTGGTFGLYSAHKIPNTDRIVTTGGGLKLWRPSDFKLDRTWSALAGRGPITVSRNGSVIAATDLYFGVTVWRPDGSLLQRFPPESDPINEPALSDDGTSIAYGTDNGFVVRNSVTGVEIRRKTFQGRYVEHVLLTPDATKVVTFDAHWDVGVFDVATGVETARRDLRFGSFSSLAMSRSGATFYVGYDNGFLQEVRTSDLAVLRTLSSGGPYVSCLSVTDDGAQLASVDLLESVKIWDTSNGSLVRTLPIPDVVSANFSPGALELTVVRRPNESGAGYRFAVVDALTGTTLRESATDSGPVTSVSTSPDSKTAVFCGGRIRFVDVQTGYETPLIPLLGSANGAEFSPDGRRLLVSRDGWSARALSMFDLSTRTLVWSRTLPNSERVRFKPTGGELYVQFPSEVQVLDTSDGSFLRSISFVLAVDGMDLSPDGSTLALSHSNGQVRLYDASSGNLLRTYTTHDWPSYEIKFSPNGKRLAVHHASSLTVVDVASLGELATFPVFSSDIALPVFTPDSSTLLMPCYEGIKMFDISRRWLARLFDTEANGSACAILPDGDQMIVGRGDGTLLKCRIHSPEMTLRLP